MHAKTAATVQVARVSRSRTRSTTLATFFTLPELQFYSLISMFSAKRPAVLSLNIFLVKLASTHQTATSPSQPTLSVLFSPPQRLLQKKWQRCPCLPLAARHQRPPPLHQTGTGTARCGKHWQRPVPATPPHPSTLPLRF